MHDDSTRAKRVLRLLESVGGSAIHAVPSNVRDLQYVANGGVPLYASTRKLLLEYGGGADESLQ